ncbi:MAG TPA: LUD domain-containing protein [Candidatus Didemnitutus sp.]|nr:LUD domain-containing protein [Candidatus Didemnitutus sp.]
MDPERDQILARVKAALAPLPKRARPPAWEQELVRMRAAPAADLAVTFAERLRAVNGIPIGSVAELVALFEREGWRHGYCDPVIWPKLKAAFPAGIKVELDFVRDRVDEYQFGITPATAAIAETGTVILTDRDTSRRLGALAPWVHVAVVRRSQILPDITAALAAMPADPNIIWCTGPSKTADVEGILIEGVHGPGRQIALVID